ncbi:MAG: hypothetical protein ISQ54_03760 [Candidatus Poseidonia sp.]|nr:hypothetical protein [Poseidonia sp.]
MRRNFWVMLATLLLFAPSLGSANPSGVGEGAFDAQCGGACHGDADMNRSSTSIVSLHSEAVAYEGLLTSVTVSIENIETTQQGLLGVFLLSSLSGAGDLPSDDGWTIISNSEGGTENYVEITVLPSQDQRNVTWTLRAPSIGQYELHGAIHHGTEDGSEAPFFGQSNTPAVVEVVLVPEDLPRLTSDYAPTTQRLLGESTTMQLETAFVESVEVEWRVAGGEIQTTEVMILSDGTWSFDLPASLQPTVVEWRAHLEGEGPSQTTPWFQLRSEEAPWTVDESAAYVQSFALIVVFMAGFMALQNRRPEGMNIPKLTDEEFEGGQI